MQEAVGNRKVLLLTFPQADIAGVYDRLKRFLGKDKSTQWMMVAPELPDINECRQDCAPFKADVMTRI
jgi:hypothetical protein